jgi:hypothetical protein
VFSEENNDETRTTRNSNGKQMRSGFHSWETAALENLLGRMFDSVFDIHMLFQICI